MCVQPELIKYYYFFLINTLNLPFLLSTRNRSLLLNKVNLRAKFKHFPEGVSLRTLVLLFKHLFLVNVLVLWKYFMFLDMNPGKLEKIPLLDLFGYPKGSIVSSVKEKSWLKLRLYYPHYSLMILLSVTENLSNLSKGNIQGWIT